MFGPFAFPFAEEPFVTAVWPADWHDKKFLADPPDIGFDASTASMKRIKQRYSPPVVVVGVT